ncbi:rho guanine nucleotide exchange factor 17-like [Centruroides vittatus]|uniref:rho guanine nucleotide exchange factor 17-like n=1 Tax=Centruroides vittatus TaxID=120091 RepID=UPI00350F807F
MTDHTTSPGMRDWIRDRHTYDAVQTGSYDCVGRIIHGVPQYRVPDSFDCPSISDGDNQPVQVSVYQTYIREKTHPTYRVTCTLQLDHPTSGPRERVESGCEDKPSTAIFKRHTTSSRNSCAKDSNQLCCCSRDDRLSSHSASEDSLTLDDILLTFERLCSEFDLSEDLATTTPDARNERKKLSTLPTVRGSLQRSGVFTPEREGGRQDGVRGQSHLPNISLTRLTKVTPPRLLGAGRRVRVKPDLPSCLIKKWEKDNLTRMEKSPRPPRSPSAGQSRLKELTDKLRNSKDKPYPVVRSSSMSHVDLTNEVLEVHSGPATLPRRRTGNCPTTTGVQLRSDGSSVSLDSAVDEGLDSETDPGRTMEPLPLLAPDKRRRKKGQSVGFRSQEHPPKSGNGRSLTYPPQRKGSGTEEDIQYSSVDSEGLKSLCVPGIIAEGSRHRSNVSLADSHYCPSEGVAEETYSDVIDSVTSADLNKLTVTDAKISKKKHHSDPGSDKMTGENVDFPELMASSKSEPDLGESPQPNSIEEKGRDGMRLDIHESAPDVQCPQNIARHRSSYQTRTGSLTPSPSLHPRIFGIDPERLTANENPEKYSTKSPQQQRRYSKKRLRGPYGEMLEEEMRKSGEKQKSSFCDDLSFLQELCIQTPTSNTKPNLFSSSQSLDDSHLKNESKVPKRKISANLPLEGDTVQHYDTPSSPELDYSDNNNNKNTNKWNDSCAENADNHNRNESFKRHQDTRTHVVGELYDTEKSYVESLQIIVNKYMKSLKSPEHAGLVDSSLVDEIFYQVPEILSHHESFLEVLRQRLTSWDSKQKVGDVFVEAFTKQQIIDTYTSFINNWRLAKEAIKLAIQAKPAFGKFLEHMAREHKGKLTLDALLIMPVQRIPRYELLIKELLKHTHVDHPDHQLLVMAQKEVHDLAVKINRVEREAFQHEQMQQKVKEIEHLIEGIMDLVQPDRTFIRYDLVSIPGGLGTKKERCLFLFSDLLLITSIKRKSGTIRKASSSSSPLSYGPLETNKYKLLLRFSLDNLDITKSSDGNVKRILKDIENLEGDVSLLNQIGEMVSNLNCQHQALDDVIKELLSNVTKQLFEKQNADNQFLSVELTITTQEGVENMTVIFPSSEKRLSWEAAFNEAKQKLALSTDRRPPPEFMYPLPIRKTRAGLQFTCASATLGLNQYNMRDVWVCNSDGYVGQVCVLSLQPDPTVTSCNGVCNARILCLASIPAATPLYQNTGRRKSIFPENSAELNHSVEEDNGEGIERTNNGNIQLDSDSSDEEDDVTDSPDDDVNKSPENTVQEENKDETDNHQPTMWLGTEDGCIHVYNCTDNIRIKRNKIKLQHSAAINCIVYLDNRVFASLANGELAIYKKDSEGGWSINEPQIVQISNSSAPITKMLAVAGKLWCGCQNNIKVFNTTSLTIEHTFQVSGDTSRAVLCMVTSGLGVWTAIQHSAVIRLFHATTYECLLDVNVGPAVTKMLSGCDDIIRQHKAACLRVTSLLACKDLLWVGTSAGVVLTLPLPHLTSTTTKLDTLPNVSGISHGHTGHVRFLTFVEMSLGGSSDCSGFTKYNHRSIRSKEGLAARRASTTATTGCKLLVISGGDGYEDFHNTGLSEAAGRDDSTNHLLLWQV